MPAIFDIIKKRRSIRKYSTRKVSKKILNEILEAARWAPSAHNAQPWRFIVLSKTEEKKVLADAMSEARVKDLIKNQMPPEHAMEIAKRSTERFEKAPTVIVACITMAEVPKHTDEDKKNVERDLAIQSLGAAIQNMLLAAYSRGLGGCWFCAPAFCRVEVREVLGLPEEFEPQALITLGYAAEKPDAPPRKPLQAILGSCSRNESSRRME